MPSHTLHHLIQRDADALQAALALDCRSARLEVQLLLQHLLGVDRAYLLAHPERELDAEEYQRHQALLARRMTGEPMAYILGRREFYGLPLQVSPHTLIPRPDTELLVELALQRLPEQGPCTVLDLGTGSGAIALALASQRPQAAITAVDASPDALDLARANAQQLHLDQIEFLLSDWFSALHGRTFDLIVSNPPYIAADDPHLEQGDVRFEPRSALISGADGLDDIRRIVAEAPSYLKRPGWLLLEHGYDQADRVRGLLERQGYDAVFSASDLAGIARVSAGCRSKSLID